MVVAPGRVATDAPHDSLEKKDANTEPRLNFLNFQLDTELSVYAGLKLRRWVRWEIQILSLTNNALAL